MTRAAANSVTPDALQRDYETIQSQYAATQIRLSEASTGERIELQSRGQRITVLEQPVVPAEAAKPNRVLIAAGGILFRILAGAGSSSGWRC